MDRGAAQKPALFVLLIFVLWTARCVRTVFQAGAINVGRIVSGLLAGIVFVDWLAVAPQCPQWLGGTLLFLFCATILLQRFIPAT
jgi:fructose-specific phosphotransferase system IIC component